MNQTKTDTKGKTPYTKKQTHIEEQTPRMSAHIKVEVDNPRIPESGFTLN